LDTDQSGTVAAVPLASGWENYTQTLQVTRMGPLVLVEGFVRRSATLSVTASQLVIVGTLPVGFRPQTQGGNGNAMHSLTASTGTLAAVRAYADPGGGFGYYSPSAGSIAIGGGWSIFNMTYRGA
jgi:hypothetical protein